MSSRPSAIIILCLILVAPVMATGAWQAKLADIANPIFTDHYPREALLEQPLPVCQGSTVSFLSVVHSTRPADFRISFAAPPQHFGHQVFHGVTSLHDLIPVHVEGNHQGRKNVPEGEVPEAWMPHQIRQAPFDVLEVIDDVPHRRLRMEAGTTGGVLAEIAVPAHAAPGLYTGHILVQCRQEQRKLFYSFEVFPVSLKSDCFIDSMHWLWIAPENLTSGPVPHYWSEKHWKLIEQAGRRLHLAGDNVIFTPHIFGREPLVRTRQIGNGDYEFDFRGFHRWLDLFDRLGFRGFVGTHLHSWMLPLHVLQADGSVRTVSLDSPEHFKVIECFLPRLYQELKRAGYLNRYRQHIMDEPPTSQIPLYKKYVQLLHTVMPGIASIDATIRDALYQDVDTAVIHLQKLRFSHDINVARRRQGRNFWIYSSCDPRPPFPNRHLDSPRLGNRLYPLLAVKYQCAGYLNWAANVYRGVDEYANSLGPFPNGSQNPGHPAGDAWFFYRGPRGLRLGLRMLNYREGMVDAALLSTLGTQHENRQHELLERVYFPNWTLPDRLNIYAMQFASYTGHAFAVEPAPYHAMRRKLLQELSKRR